MPLIHNQTSLPLEAGKSLFDYADDLAVRVPTSCNRNGECHECIVEVRRGMDALEPLNDTEEFLRENYRLACQARVIDIEADIEFNILRRQPRILTESIARTDIELDPLTVREGDNVIFKGESLPPPLRGGTKGGGPRIVDRYRGRILGIAADIGTTTVAMNLVDLETGDILYTASFENPQRFGGSDVMHRISYDTGAYPGELQAVLISSINYEIGEMVRALKIRRRHIVEFVAVGNTTMRDILFGIDVETIGQKPYKSHVETDFTDGKRDTTALNVPAHELGIRINPNANIYSGPLIASHIGSDVAADLLTIAIDEQDDIVMLIDIGTNTEIIAGNKHQLHAASCPAGPAFEGGNVTYAMPGYNGAVERVKIPDSDPVGAFRETPLPETTADRRGNPCGRPSPSRASLPLAEGESKAVTAKRTQGTPDEGTDSRHSGENPRHSHENPRHSHENPRHSSENPRHSSENPRHSGGSRNPEGPRSRHSGGSQNPEGTNSRHSGGSQNPEGTHSRHSGGSQNPEEPQSRHSGGSRNPEGKGGRDAPLLTTIGNTPPIGICGSGLIDLLAELRRHDIMNVLGNFNDGSDEFTFHHENRLTLSRADISALAQAKAANYCGQNIVLETTGTSPTDYTRLYLAGGFANYINIQNAINIGFIPNIDPDSITKIGNASLQGATIMLTNATKRATIEHLATTITHIELETNPNFFDHFVEGCQFKR